MSKLLNSNLLVITEVEEQAIIPLSFFKEDEFKLVADLIYKVIKGLSENKNDNSKIENEVKKEIIDLCSSFPIYGN